MGAMSIWHWIVLLVIVLLLFGAGKIPRLMGDMAKGVKAFKSGLKEEDEAKAETPPPPPAPPPQVQSTQPHAAEAQKEREKDTTKV